MDSCYSPFLDRNTVFQRDGRKTTNPDEYNIHVVKGGYFLSLRAVNYATQGGCSPAIALKTPRTITS